MIRDYLESIIYSRQKKNIYEIVLCEAFSIERIIIISFSVNIIFSSKPTRIIDLCI